MSKITLYLRPNCHLCDQVLSDLDSLQAEYPHTLVVIDIESDPALHTKYVTDIPVLEIGPYTLRAPITRQEIMVALGAARDSQAFSPDKQIRPGHARNAADRFSLWLADHWLFGVNLIFILYLGLPFLAPVLMKAGAEFPARIIYTAYSPLCHQLGFRSFFMYGEQPYYPRASSGITGMQTFGEATGLNENDLLPSRSYVGNEQVGYKVALCERDVAIYGAIILFALIYGLTGKKLPPLHWILWLIIGIIPIGLDGFSQLISQLPFSILESILPYRESTPTLRLITGFLFGFSTAWFGLPYAEESMRETRTLVLRHTSENSAGKHAI